MVTDDLLQAAFVKQQDFIHLLHVAMLVQRVLSTGGVPYRRTDNIQAYTWVCTRMLARVKMGILTGYVTQCSLNVTGSDPPLAGHGFPSWQFCAAWTEGRLWLS